VSKLVIAILFNRETEVEAEEEVAGKYNGTTTLPLL